ncbi:MAG: TetR/AcrR family transcriptional regulator [Planctomycetota bacterium]
MPRRGKKTPATVSLQQTARDAQRAAVLEAASTLLEAEGPTALTVRRLADAVGASTMMIYTLFGGKDGLAAALHAEGFARLSAAIVGVPPRADRPLEWLLAIADAYRDCALANRSFYLLMHFPVLAGCEPPGAERIREERGWQVLEQAIRAAIDCKALPAGTRAVVVADALWGVVHGMVSLELAGYFPGERTAAPRFRAAVRAIVAGFAS